MALSMGGAAFIWDGVRWSEQAALPVRTATRSAVSCVTSAYCVAVAGNELPPWSTIKQEVVDAQDSPVTLPRAPSANEGADHCLPSHVTAWPKTSKAAQNEGLGHDTAATKAGAGAGLSDQAVPSVGREDLSRDPQVLGQPGHGRCWRRRDVVRHETEPWQRAELHR
jgi:hypothetical protein